MRTIRIGSPMEVYLKYRLSQLTEEFDKKFKSRSMPYDCMEELRIAYRERTDELLRLQSLLKTKTIREGR